MCADSDGPIQIEFTKLGCKFWEYGCHWSWSPASVGHCEAWQVRVSAFFFLLCQLKLMPVTEQCNKESREDPLPSPLPLLRVPSSRFHRVRWRIWILTCPSISFSAQTFVHKRHAILSLSHLYPACQKLTIPQVRDSRRSHAGRLLCVQLGKL